MHLLPGNLGCCVHFREGWDSLRKAACVPWPFPKLEPYPPSVFSVTLGNKKESTRQGIALPTKCCFPSLNLNLKELTEAPLPGGHSQDDTLFISQTKASYNPQQRPSRPLHACKMQPTFSHPRCKGKQNFFQGKVEFSSWVVFFYFEKHILDL